MITHNLDLTPLLLQLHLRRPVRPRLVARVVLVRHLAQDHQVRLVVAVRVDLDGAVVAPGDVRPDRFAEVADLWRLVGISDVMAASC